MREKNPILNSPYEEPILHYSTALDGSLDYNNIINGRRIFSPGIQVIPQRQGEQGNLLEINDFSTEYGKHLINLIRDEIKKWRNTYEGTTRVTRELLNFWFRNPERHAVRKLFFAQRESIETAIWLNEVADKTNAGQNILNKLQASHKTVSESKGQQLPRIAFKMATGTGKTVVMSCLIVYNFFNRQEYRNDIRFADYFLVLTPGVTIRNRLSVLFVDKRAQSKTARQDYYAIRDLVPQNIESQLNNLNARLVVTNYHSFEPKTLQGNKRSPFDGKLDSEGKKQEAKEDYNQVIKRILGKFKKDSRLLILNDEAHHCYLPKSKSKTKDNEEVDENKRAAVWFTGLTEIFQRYKIRHIYDLSATPYYLSGSGYPAYSLYPWVVSDFGLIEAIESGLVKIPFLPESDNTQELSIPVLKDLYNHVKDDPYMPSKKGMKKRRSEAKKEGSSIIEAPPMLPPIVKGALDQFYNHYKDYYEGVRKKHEEKLTLFTTPPVFIIICNNTSVSKEVYKFIAGYEEMDKEGNIFRAVDGHYPLFSNYDSLTKRPKHKSPTLLIDSDALENSDQVNDEFKKIFMSELDEFKKEFARIHGQGSAQKIADAEILREVVNTVGKQGKLGSHIRCVVSVSMLTEGWDANNVTHIMGIRAFGSQLLCEQVAGRALRRMNYFLKHYDKDGNPTEDLRKAVIEKYPPEYAHIIGVPFKMFKGGTTEIPEPLDYTHIQALVEREKELEISFPNVAGYRLASNDEDISYDFTIIEDYEFDGSVFPLETKMASPFSEHEEKLEVKSVLEKRDQELIYLFSKELIKYHFSDDDNNPRFQLFGQIKDAVEYWYSNKVKLLNITDSKYKRLLYFEAPNKIISHIIRGIKQGDKSLQDKIHPVFNYYNRMSSSKYVNGNTSKEVYKTSKSHVNYVVMDSGWEGKASKAFEELPQIQSYVKNNFLGFTIPYIKSGLEKRYFPDFIARIKNGSNKENYLIIEITGMNKDKAEKKWYVENRWLPAVNAISDKYNLGKWDFVEVADDIRDIKNEIVQKIESI